MNLQTNDNEGAPQSTGARLKEILTRDIWNFFYANLIFCVSILPGGAIMLLGIAGNSLMTALAGGMLLGMLGAPFWCGLCDTILRSLRDEAGYWSMQYRRALRNNWKESLFPGILSGTFLVLWLFETHALIGEHGIPVTAFAVLLETAFLWLGVLNYLFPQITLVKVSGGRLWTNSIRLFVGTLPVAAGAVMIELFYWGVFLLLFPRSVPFLLVGGFWLPELVVLMALRKPLHTYLHLGN